LISLVFPYYPPGITRREFKKGVCFEKWNTPNRRGKNKVGTMCSHYTKKLRAGLSIAMVGALSV
jgi:hypothetical protein